MIVGLSGLPESSRMASPSSFLAHCLMAIAFDGPRQPTVPRAVRTSSTFSAWATLPPFGGDRHPGTDQSTTTSGFTCAELQVVGARDLNRQRRAGLALGAGLKVSFQSFTGIYGRRDVGLKRDFQFLKTEMRDRLPSPLIIRQGDPARALLAYHHISASSS